PRRMLQAHREDVLVGRNFRSVTLSATISLDSNASSRRIRGGCLRRQAGQERMKRLSHINSQDRSPLMENLKPEYWLQRCVLRRLFLMSSINERHIICGLPPVKKVFVCTFAKALALKLSHVEQRNFWQGDDSMIRSCKQSAASQP